MFKKKRIAISVILLVIFSIILLIAGNFFVKHKIKYFLEHRLPKNISNSYSSISVDVFGGSVALNDVKINIRNKRDTVTNTSVTIDKLIVNDLSYYHYFVNNTIGIDDIIITKPSIIHYSKNLRKRKDQQEELAKLYKILKIKNLKVEEAKVIVLDRKGGALNLETENLNLQIEDVLVNKETINKIIPFQFENYFATGGHIFLKANSFEDISLENFKINDNVAVFNNIKLNTKYSRSKFSQRLKKERDHVNVLIPKIEIQALEFGFDPKLYVKSDHIKITEPIASIFRDKLVNDDVSNKFFYNKMMRAIPFNISINKTEISNAKISYQEKVKLENGGGEIHFSNMNLVLKEFSKETPLVIDGNGIFMKNTLVKINWTLDPASKNDAFIFKGELGSLPMEQLNNFTVPNLNLKLLGTTDKIYFTIDGDKFESNMDMRIKYSKFEVILLNSKSKKKNKFLSSIASLFIKKSSKSEISKFKNVTTTVKPDTTKSFFNYLWLNLRAGLLESLTTN